MKLKLILKFSAFSWLILLVVYAIYGLFIDVNFELKNSYQLPSLQNFFGTDSFGRNYFVRMSHATFNSLIIGIFSTAATVILLTLFTLSCFIHKYIRSVILIFVDIIINIPNFILMMVFGFFLLNYNFSNSLKVILILSLISWPSRVRTLFALTYEISNSEYYKQSIMMGASQWHLLMKHIVPQLRNYSYKISVFYFPVLMLQESVLSISGFGLKMPQISWGILILEGWKYILVNPVLCILPTAFLILTVCAMQLLLPDDLF